MNNKEEKIKAILRYYLSFHEAEDVEEMLEMEEYSADDIIEYIKWCRDRYNAGLDTDFEEWLEDRKPRVTIGFVVTEGGHTISETLEFPKRNEDMKNGSEYEWYYSLREITDKIMALEIGECIPFKIRDDDTSVGSVVRIK